MSEFQIVINCCILFEYSSQLESVTGSEGLSTWGMMFAEQLLKLWIFLFLLNRFTSNHQNAVL